MQHSLKTPRPLLGLLVILTLSFTIQACGESVEPLPLSEEENQDIDPGNDDEEPVEIGDLDDPEERDLRCDGAVIDEWPLLDLVSAETLTSTETDGVFEARIHAVAGGMGGSMTNPFIYLNLETGEQVEITDLESLDSTEWDLAFKRVVIRTNSGDSGPADARLAKKSGTSLEAELTAPADTDPHHQDRTFDDQCVLQTDPINNPYTAFNYLNPLSESGSWYGYSSGGAMGVTPIAGDVYFLRRDDRSVTYAIEIKAWEGGVYELAWRALEH